MGKLWSCLLLLVFLTTTSRAQKPVNTTFSYYTVASNRWIAEIKLTRDSLLLDKKKAADIIDRERYEVAGEEQQGDYLLVYVKNQPLTLRIPKRVYSLSKAPSTIQKFSLFVFSFSKDKEKLFVSRDDKSYTSLEETKNANRDINFRDKYFISWYSNNGFKKITQYPDLKDADKATVQQVVDEWISECKNDRDKYHTHFLNVYAVFSTVLISHHLNPLADMSDLDKKISEYHIVVPKVNN